MGCNISREKEGYDVNKKKGEQSKGPWKVPEKFTPHEFAVTAFTQCLEVVKGFYTKKSPYQIEGLCVKTPQDAKGKSCEEMGITVGNLSIRCFGFCTPQQYVENLDIWMHKKLLEELPIDSNDSDFHTLCRRMARRIFRVWGHMFFKHKDLFKRSPNKDDLRLRFRIFIAFAFQYDLLKRTDDEVEILNRRVSKIIMDLKKIKEQDPDFIAFFTKFIPYDGALLATHFKNRDAAVTKSSRSVGEPSDKFDPDSRTVSKVEIGQPEEEEEEEAPKITKKG